MHGSLPGGRNATIKRNGSLAAEKTEGGKSAADDENWFAEATQSLYAFSGKPGTALYYTAELGDVRLCQRYAAGDVKPSAYFLRRLLRSDHGEQWLNAVMDGSEADWWLTSRRERAVGAAAMKALDI